MRLREGEGQPKIILESPIVESTPFWGDGVCSPCILSASLTFRGKGAQGLTPGPPSGWSVEEPWERSGPCSLTDPGSCHSGLWLWARHLTVLSLSFPLCKMGQWQLVRRLGTEAGTGVE